MNSETKKFSQKFRRNQTIYRTCTTTKSRRPSSRIKKKFRENVLSHKIPAFFQILVSLLLVLPYVKATFFRDLFGAMRCGCSCKYVKVRCQLILPKKLLSFPFFNEKISLSNKNEK